MKLRVRVWIDRASRVATFIREHRADLKGLEKPLARFEGRLARVTQLAQDETTSRLSAKAARAQRDEIGAAVVADLRVLGRLAQAAREDSVVIPIVVRFPGPRHNQVEFLAGARAAVETSRQYIATLVEYGMDPGQPDQLTAQLDAFEALMASRVAAMQMMVATTRALTQAASDLNRTTHQLSTMVVHTLAGNPVALRAWESASGLRLRRRKDEPEPLEVAPPLPALPAPAAPK